MLTVNSVFTTAMVPEELYRGVTVIYILIVTFKFKKLNVRPWSPFYQVLTIIDCDQICITSFSMVGFNCFLIAWQLQEQAGSLVGRSLTLLAGPPDEPQALFDDFRCTKKKKALGCYWAIHIKKKSSIRLTLACFFNVTR